MRGGHCFTRRISGVYLTLKTEQKAGMRMKCRRMLLLSSFILSGLMLVIQLTGCSSS